MALGEKYRTWLETRLSECAPPAELSPGTIGRALQDLTSAIVAFEAGSGQVFGMTLPGADRAELTPLAERGRAVLDQWRRRLEAEHGDEGVRVLETIAARMGLSLPEMKSRTVEQARAAPIPDAIARALDRFARALADRAGREAYLRERGDDEPLPDIRTGEPRLQELEAFFARHEAGGSGALPLAYLELMKRWNGIETRASETATVPAEELSEPTIWPLDSCGDHYLLDAAELEGVESPFVIGEVADSGFLVLDVAPGHDGEAPVFWLERGTPPFSLARSHTELLELLADHHAMLEGVLEALKAPGWGA
jgi:hypothetical protein